MIEINRGTAGWSYVDSSSLNRRITPFTPMDFSGPVRGQTPASSRAYSPTGAAGRGTINNCANGTMPWHTYLTNEENWAGYFRREAGDNAAPHRRARRPVGRRVHPLRLGKTEQQRCAGRQLRLGDRRRTGGRRHPLSPSSTPPSTRPARRRRHRRLPQRAQSNMAGWSRSTRSIPPRRRASAPRSAG